MHQVVVGQAATEAEAITLAAELEATYPWVAHDTPRGRRLTEALARRGGRQFVVVPPSFLQGWADVEFSR